MSDETSVPSEAQKFPQKSNLNQSDLEAEYGLAEETTITKDGTIFRSQIRDKKTGTFMPVGTKVLAGLLLAPLFAAINNQVDIYNVFAYGNDVPELLKTIHYIRSSTTIIVSEKLVHVAIKTTRQNEDAEIFNTYLHGVQCTLSLKL